MKIRPINPKGRQAARLRGRKRQLLARVRLPPQGLPGSLALTHRRCGKASCHCARGKGHPVWSLTFMRRGRKRVERNPGSLGGGSAPTGGKGVGSSRKGWARSSPLMPNCSPWGGSSSVEGPLGVPAPPFSRPLPCPNFGREKTSWPDNVSRARPRLLGLHPLLSVRAWPRTYLGSCCWNGRWKTSFALGCWRLYNSGSIRWPPTGRRRRRTVLTARSPCSTTTRPTSLGSRALAPCELEPPATAVPPARRSGAPCWNGWEWNRGGSVVPWPGCWPCWGWWCPMRWQRSWLGCFSGSASTR